jgi:hypothetical protein
MDSGLFFFLQERDSEMRFRMASIVGGDNVLDALDSHALDVINMRREIEERMSLLESIEGGNVISLLSRRRLIKNPF